MQEKNIERRGFLNSMAGLCLGASIFPCTPCQTNVPDRIDAVDSGSFPYDQAVARTSHPHLIGYPPSWKMVEEGFHPIAPERVVIIQPTSIIDGTPQYNRGRLERPTEFVRIRQRLTQRHPESVSGMSDQQLSLVVELTDHLAGHYRLPATLGMWAYSLARQECLCQTRFVQSVAITCGLRHRDIQLSVPGVDWWIFVFPAGVPDWRPGGVRNPSMHAMFVHMLWCRRDREFPVEVHMRDLAVAAAQRTSAWVQMSSADQASVARFANEQLLREVLAL